VEDSLRRKLLWCRMPAAIMTSSWLRSGVSSWPPRVRVLPAWWGSRLSCSWATTREAGLPSWRRCPVMSISGSPVSAGYAAFVACICAALYRCGTDPVRLAADRSTFTLMCRAITEAFAALHASGTAGLPPNLAVLRSPLLRVVAVRYWARTMRSPMGELCFAAHARHAEVEMRALARDVIARITGSSALAELLTPSPGRPASWLPER
jgi:hypothetical protein